MEAATSLAPIVGVHAACLALGVARASFYRRRGAPRVEPVAPLAPSASTSTRRHPRALTAAERQDVLDVLHSPRFVDVAPAEVYATLLDEGRYLASERTMYRLLAAAGETGERRHQRVHPAYHKPELLATGPNQVWSWDITKLLGPVTWTYYYLYVLLDIYSRYVTGWLLAEREQAALAERLIAEATAHQGIAPGQLTLHADRGTAMTSKPVAWLLADLGVTRSHSRPHTANDNPFSEAQFKTLKYQPDFPARFGGLEDARAFCRRFFPWYNTAHRHAGIGYFTPEAVHSGHAPTLHAARTQVLTAIYDVHPERFVRHVPHPPALPTHTWINPPSSFKEKESEVSH
jgi:putative transposase